MAGIAREPSLPFPAATTQEEKAVNRKLLGVYENRDPKERLGFVSVSGESNSRRSDLELFICGWDADLQWREIKIDYTLEGLYRLNRTIFAALAAAAARLDRTDESLDFAVKAFEDFSNEFGGNYILDVPRKDV